MMRITLITTLALLLLASSARAQQVGSTQPPVGSVDLGLRATSVSGDEARFQRFRDIGDGAIIDHLRFDREGRDWFVRTGADHLGRTDQRYWAEYGGHSKVKIKFEWDQIPLNISQDTRSLYSVQSPGVLRIADEIQQGIQAGQITLADAVGRANPFELRSRRDMARLDFAYAPSRELDVKVNFKTTHRDGTMPYGATFGFNNAVEVPAPIDTRTTDLGAALQWTNARGMLRIGYDGSWFGNHIQSLTWDNPWKATDAPAATIGSQGRLALPPSSSLQSVSTAGSMKLPANSRFTANVSVGRWNQNEALLPYTINTLIPVSALPRATADASARTLAMSYNFTSRPSPLVWLNARYRYYDFDNRTPPFEASGFVLLDQRADSGDMSEPLSSTRKNFDVDASFTPIPFTALRVGYGREDVDRTFRIFEKTTDNVARASVDSTLHSWLMVRGIVEHAVRTGSHFDGDHLAEMGEQPTLRHYDIADRTRNRATALLQLSPAPIVGVSFAAAVGKDDYRNSGFGLRSNDNRSYTLTADVTPREEITAGVTFIDEKYTALQASRQGGAGALFVDPTRDWSIDSADKARTLNASIDVIKLVPKTELRTAYNISRSTSAYRYLAPANSTLPALVQLPSVTNELQTATAEVRYFLTPKLVVGLVYWHDAYRVNDFALGTSTMSRLDLPGALFLGYVYRPYTANSAWARIIYFW